MATFCFSDESGGVTVERDYPVGKAPESIKLDDGRRAHRDYAAEHRTPVRRAGAGWPMPPCYASGVHASQAGELREFLRKSGVPTEVNRNGDPIYRNVSHQRAALKVRGMHNNADYFC